MEESRISKFLTEASNKPIRFLFLAISAFVTGVTLIITEIGLIQWISLILAGVVLLARASKQEIKYRHLYLDGVIFFTFITWSAIIGLHICILSILCRE